MEKTIHKRVICTVSNCADDATHWYDTKGTALEVEGGENTFYLCDKHVEEMSEDGETVIVSNLITGENKQVELAVYSCSRDCTICN